MHSSNVPNMTPSQNESESQQPLWGALSDDELEADAFFETWLALQCSLIIGSVRGVLVLGEPDTGPYIPKSFWPVGQSATPLLAGVAERTLQVRQAVVERGEQYAAVTYPMLVDGNLYGLVAIETTLQNDTALQEAVRLLQWGMFGIVSHMRREQSLGEQVTRERLVATLDLVASTLIEDGFEPAANTLATDLAIRLDCDRVGIGFVRNKNAQVVAISHSGQFGKRMNLIYAIGMAMDEALDQKSIILLPERVDETLVTRSHVALTRENGSGSVLTVPFVVGDFSTGAFTFERPLNRPFSHEDIELCQAVVALSSRMLEAKRLNERRLVMRVKDAIREQLAKFTGPHYIRRKLAVMLLVLAVLFFSFAKVEYKVGANATLEGYVHRVLIAPFDGYVATAIHRAGDVVTTGSVLATLDDSDIKLEYFKWISQRAQYSKQYQDAAAQHDRAQSNITLAQVQQAEAQVSLLESQLSRTEITAPFDGLVVNGDLNQSLGSAVKRGQVLFEVAPLNLYRVILEVDQGEITDIQKGQKGTLKLSSIPDAVFPLTIIQLTPVSSSKEGRSYFRVEAVLDRVSDRLSPGMEGVGKIEVGERKLIWILTHKIVDWIRLTFWSWF
ncbi:MAG: multidrug resistance efflux pump [Methylophilaceae bacterium]